MGEGRAGKSSLLRFLTDKKFVADLLSTAGISVEDCVSEITRMELDELRDAGVDVQEFTNWKGGSTMSESERTLRQLAASKASEPQAPQKMTFEAEDQQAEEGSAEAAATPARQEQEQKTPSIARVGGGGDAAAGGGVSSTTSVSVPPATTSSLQIAVVTEASQPDASPTVATQPSSPTATSVAAATTTTAKPANPLLSTDEARSLTFSVWDFGKLLIINYLVID